MTYSGRLRIGRSAEGGSCSGAVGVERDWSCSGTVGVERDWSCSGTVGVGLKGTELYVVCIAKQDQ
jgi:hypothetical protein